jgi:hypothetical protein
VVASTEKLSPQPLLLAVQEQVGSWEMAASQGLLRLEVDGIPHWVQVKAIQEEGGLIPTRDPGEHPVGPRL